MFNGHKSSIVKLSYSIPQGSILGPQLFSIYINDVIHSVTDLNLILFADDTCLYNSHNDINSLINQANLELININNWLIANKLTLNTDKSHCIIFKRNKALPHNLNEIKINNVTLNIKEDTDFLGITLNHNLTWHNHIKYLVSRLNKIKGIIYQTRNSFTQNSLKLIYYSLIYPVITYGNIIWGKTSPSVLKPLDIVHKNIIRTIMYRSRYYHTNQDFIYLKLLKLSDINFYFSCIFVFKSINDMTYPTDYFHFNENIRYDFRHTNIDLQPPFMRSTQSQSSPAYYCCHYWNSLPLEVRQSPSVFSLKRSLKNKILQSYYLQN